MFIGSDQPFDIKNYHEYKGKIWRKKSNINGQGLKLLKKVKHGILKSSIIIEKISFSLKNIVYFNILPYHF